MNLSSYDISSREAAGCLAAGAAAGLALAYAHSAAAGLCAAYLFAAMLLITVADARRMLVPDVLSLPSIAVGLLAAAALAADPATAIAGHAIAAALGGLAFQALRMAYRWRRGVEGLGLGDVKLAAAAGAWAGLANLPHVILLASFAALALVLVKRVTGGEPLNRSAAVPFGSFLAPSVVVVWAWGLWPA